MLDSAWPRIVRTLSGAVIAAPVVRWPTDRVHVIVAPPDDQPDLDLPPEPPAPRVDPHDELIVDYITQSVGISVRAAAADLGLSKSMVSRCLARMHKLGRIEFDGEGWLAR